MRLALPTWPRSGERSDRSSTLVCPLEVAGSVSWIPPYCGRKAPIRSLLERCERVCLRTGVRGPVSYMVTSLRRAVTAYTLSPAVAMQGAMPRRNGSISDTRNVSRYLSDIPWAGSGACGSAQSLRSCATGGAHRVICCYTRDLFPQRRGKS